MNKRPVRRVKPWKESGRERDRFGGPFGKHSGEKPPLHSVQIRENLGPSKVGVVGNQLLCVIVHDGTAYAARRSLKNGEITRIDGLIIRGGERKEDTPHSGWKDLRAGEVGFTSGEDLLFYVYKAIPPEEGERIRQAYRVFSKLGLSDKGAIRKFKTWMLKHVRRKYALVENRGKVYAVTLGVATPDKKFFWEVIINRGAIRLSLMMSEKAARIAKETRDQIPK
ncbi:MAG: hypothetical protein NT157_01925 [Candidatus Micrarchaeota archaeon]|nr:hypothetical protein [Candidatus Micrarchaeota archaeon]